MQYLGSISLTQYETCKANYGLCQTFTPQEALQVLLYFLEHYELGLLNGMIYGAILLYTLHCGCSMHAGIVRDIEQGTMIEICYTTYFFIKVTQ